MASLGGRSFGNGGGKLGARFGQVSIGIAQHAFGERGGISQRQEGEIGGAGEGRGKQRAKLWRRAEEFGRRSEIGSPG